MRWGMSDMARGKKGQVLLLALIIMFVGAVILTGLFQYLGTSLLLATRGEENAVSYYAADSGIEDTILWLQHKPWETPDKSLAGWKACNPLLSQPCGNTYEINGRNVSVSVGEAFDSNTFLITSNATNDNGVRTTIESYLNIEYYELAMFGYGALTSNTSVTIQPGCVVDGNVSVPDADPSLVDNKGTLNGSIVPLPGEWPTAEQVREMFLPLVDESNHFLPGSIIDVKDTPTIWSLYGDGDLTILSSEEDLSTTLNGTVYVTGNLDIGKANKDFTLNLNGQAIIVEGELVMGGGTIITGSGFIIAIGDIKFLPQTATSEDDYVFLLSVAGKIDLQPKGDFQGSVLGVLDVGTQPKYRIEWTDPNAAGLEFPVIDTFKILTYDIVDR